MREEPARLAETHWMLEILQDIDVGLVVLDRDYRIELWNGFMENHSGVSPAAAKGRVLFELFPQLPENWFRDKAEMVFLLGNRAFTTWEQRPHPFPFRTSRPITGVAELMYQNVTLLPLMGTDGALSHICVIVYDVTEMALGKRALTSANTELERLSRTDRLTGLSNRGCWEEALAKEFTRFQRTGEAVSLVMLDIDHFKAVNDSYGHVAGDAVIRAVSELLGRNLRETDLAGRYGGEEFGVILIGTDAASARFFAERLRKRVAEAAVPVEGAELRVTVSLGIAELGKGVGDHVQWIAQADRALYAAKEGGRNCTRIAGQE